MIVARDHKNISLPASDISLKVDNTKSVENFVFQTKQVLLWKFCHFYKKVVFVVTRNVVSKWKTLLETAPKFCITKLE